MSPLYPALYQINTRVWLFELGQRLGRAASLDDISDEDLAQIAGLGFDWVWLLGVWQTGPVGRRVALSIPELWEEYRRALPDCTDDDVCGSPFSISGYTVHADFGGDGALERLRSRLNKHGLRLMLDFVPNHTAHDHPWVFERPEFYVPGDESRLASSPQNYCRILTHKGSQILAYGRDPYFSGWSDTLQLNYRHAGLRQAMIAELQAISDRCDGVRCDMAMLILPDVFQRSWGGASLPADGTPPVDASFWTEAIGQVRGRSPDFLFLAEVYWDLEWTLQQQGFDATYDKRLHDRLQRQDAAAVRGHLRADLDFQRKSARFLENHDEPRAATCFPPDVHEAAAVLAFLVPGLRFVHEGELEGRRVRIPMQLRRRPQEAVDARLLDFYGRLLACLRRPEVRDGSWQLISCRPAGPGNSTADPFIAGLWTGSQDTRFLTVVNYGPTQSQCYVPLPIGPLQDQTVLLRDQLSSVEFEGQASDLLTRGLYLDLPGWGYHAFEVIGEALKD